ncbi:OmpA family protein [Litoribacter alkaliphilus]|uniref:OmpA family protein n=1 Tax=Litoribacter ruber TaxID=702568 RepID=A0AAP2G235_9BACT|nr:OmpA family protein [Litoribacter alkaliphilus]MBS9525157.1 OmpA family protein [Litoribacter alkaliphilus]
MIQITKPFQKAGIFTMLAFSALGTAQAQQIDLSAVNTEYDEQHPVLAPSGDLYFSVGFHPKNKGGVQDAGDIWMSRPNASGQFSEPQQVHALSSKGNDVLIGFPSENEALVYHDGREMFKGIHRYHKGDQGWQYGEMVKILGFRTNSDHFSGRLHANGKIMVMTLESFSSYGNEDIYVSFFENGKWSTPQNLGPQINTYRQEMTPSLSEDTKTLYFSSNGHGGQGGRNVFYATRLDESWENWTTPAPVGEINTEGVELGYLMANADNLAIYTSTQNSEGFGDLMIADIMQKQMAEAVIEEQLPEVEKKPTKIETVNNTVLPAKVPAPESPRKAEKVILDEVQPRKVTGSASQPSMPKTLSIKVLDIQTLKEVDYQIREVKAGEETVLTKKEIEELSGDRRLTIFAKGYFPQTFLKNTLTELRDPVMLTPAAKGNSIVLDNVLFKRGTADLTDISSLENIKKLASFLKDNPELKVRIEGHTDNLGDPQLNKELSMSRASMIRNLLIDEGVKFERIRVSGWGGTKPISENQTEEGRNMNRRVELVILD